MPITTRKSGRHDDWSARKICAGSQLAEEKYAAVLITLIEAYEEEHHSIPDASPVEVLRTLMDANNLRQKDLVSVFGSESIVSEVLHRKRDLNRAHIEKLSKRFHVSPAVFFSRTT